MFSSRSPRSRKGQAAIEFIISKAYAILGLLSILGLMGYFITTQSGLLPNKCEVRVPFVCMEYAAYPGGEILVGLQNAGETIEYVNVTLVCDEDRAVRHTFESFDVLKNQGRINETLLRFTCPDARARIGAHFWVSYRNEDEQVVHNADGILRLHVEGG